LLTGFDKRLRAGFSDREVGQLEELLTALRENVT
jgi:hypothetical protein